MVKNKRANMILGALFIVIFLFAFGILTFFIFKTSDTINDVIQEDTELTNESKAIYDDFNDSYPNIFDAAFIMAIIVLWITALIFSFFIDTNPLLFGIIIFLLIFIFYIGASLSNQFSDIMDESDNAVQAAEFPMTNWVFDNFLVIIVIISFTILIALFAKFGSGV